jgi:hypothetical protein
MMIDTLKDAQVAWKHTIENDGGHCPCCDRWGKIYGYSITKANTKALLWLCVKQKDCNGYVNVRNNVPDYVLRSTLSTLSWWGLVERPIVDASDLDEKKNKHDGYWRVTELGKQFARGLIQMPKRVFIYNNMLQGVSTQTVYIKDCVEGFNYEEMMQTIFTEEVA